MAAGDWWLKSMTTLSSPPFICSITLSGGGAIVASCKAHLQTLANSLFEEPQMNLMSRILPSVVTANETLALP
jgi:hypothetical protein